MNILIIVAKIKSYKSSIVSYYNKKLTSGVERLKQVYSWK